MESKERKSVGVIGLGIIGSRAAAVLRAAGWHTFVWNRTPAPHPNFLGSPGEVADMADVLQIFVADSRAMFDVLDQLGPYLTPNHIVCCHATIGPEATLEAAQMVKDRGARFLDAPFTGSKVASEKGQLVYYLGGDEATCDAVRPVLEATSKAILRIGEIGQAAVVKVVTNMIAAASVQVLAESLAICRKGGIRGEILGDAMALNACRSGTMDLKLPLMLQKEYEAHFSLKHMLKDVQLGVHLAHQLDLNIPVTESTAGVLSAGITRGWGDLDFAALFRHYAYDLGDEFRPLESLEETVALRLEAPARVAARDEAPAKEHVLPVSEMYVSGAPVPTEPVKVVHLHDDPLTGENTAFPV